MGKWEVTMKGWAILLILKLVCNHSETTCFFSHIILSSTFSVSVGTEMMFCAEGCRAVIDTGSSYITGPASSVSVLMKSIGAQLDESGVSLTHKKLVFCKNSPPVLILHIVLSTSTKSAVTPWRCCPVSLSTWEARRTHSHTRIMSYG